MSRMVTDMPGASGSDPTATKPAIRAAARPPETTAASGGSTRSNWGGMHGLAGSGHRGRPQQFHQPLEHPRQ